MKRFVFSVMMVLMAYLSVMGQTILPFVQDGKVWIYKVEVEDQEDIVWDEIFSLEGDTMINSRECLKLYYSSDSNYGHYNHVYKGALYEDIGNVYIFTPSSTTPALMCDFTSKIGSVIKVGKFELRIKEKNLIKYHDEYLKNIFYTPLEDEGFEGNWIEGIGVPWGGNLTSFIDGAGPWYDGRFSRYLNMCMVNNRIVFNSDEFYKTAQIVTSVLKSSVQPSDKIFYDLSGRKIDSSIFTLRSSLKRGIYIQNGKKVAVK